MRTDPICKMLVEDNTELTVERDGVTYYFCSEGCLEKFKSRPAGDAGKSDPDLIIIGGGPAALTAGVYASNLNLDTFLITGYTGGHIIDSSRIQNYMGFDFITGPELMGKFKRQLVGTDYIDHIVSQVEKLEKTDAGFTVTTSDLRKYRSRALIFAPGMTIRKVRVPGEDRFRGKGLYYGGIHDLSLIDNKDVAVIGGSDMALQIIERVLPVVKQVHILCNAELTADSTEWDQVLSSDKLWIHENIEVLGFAGEEVLDNVRFKKKYELDTTTLPVSAVFVALGMKPNSLPARGLVELNSRREIVIKPDCSTKCEGFFAAGDVTDTSGKRLIIAAGEGAKAALAARRYLIGLKKQKH